MNDMKKSNIFRLMIGLIFFAGAVIPQLTAQSDTIKAVMVEEVGMIPPINPDRPSQADGAYVTPKGYFEMENGFSITDTDPGFLYYYPSTVWKVGVNQNFEVRLITEYIDIQHEGLADVHGLLPIQVGFKAKLLDEHGVIPQAAFLGHLSLPGVASTQFQTDYFAPSMSLAFQNNISQRFNVFYDLGAKWDGQDPRPTFLYALGVGANVIHGLGVYIEAYGDLPQQLEDDYHHRLDGGVSYLISNDVMVDLSGGIGLSDNAPEKYVAIGFSYRFKM